MAKMKPLVMLLIMCVVFMGALIEVSTATDYTLTWSMTSNAKAWGESQKFTMGDTITFVYQPFHDVLEVSESAYESCSAVNPLSAYTGGRTTIALTAPGPRYFICGVQGHCPLMKLAINVASSSSPPPTSSSSSSSSL
ncbi:uclacyanin 1-like, partial [Ananas comosus]|uniref:Uclacyanin 1-like n=1 Tax=Ananas comosus TaxID=4615 RepID=A0A6P5FNW5_ANACO